MTAPLTRATAVGTIFEQTVVEGLTRTQIVQYAGASGDFNPLHSDEVFAVKVGGFAQGVFAHGMLTMALTGRLLTALAAPEALRAFGVRFKSQVWPGDTLTTRATVTAVDRVGDETVVRLDLSTANQDGVEVVSGYAGVAVDG